MLELEFVVFHIALRCHNIILVLGSLGRELRQVGTTHLSHLYHGLSALLIEFAGLQTLFGYCDGFGGVENLHVELHDAFLDVAGIGHRVDQGLLGGKFVEAYGVLVAVAVPHRPVGVYAITPAIVYLVDARLHIAIGHRTLSGRDEWPVNDVLTGRGTHRG